jgi:hypothetical protein
MILGSGDHEVEMHARAEARQARIDDDRSLELVQRLVISSLLAVVLGAPTAALALYSPVLAETDRAAGIGLWIMCGVIGLTAVAAIRAVHGRFPLSLFLLIGLGPAAVSALFLF